MRRDRRSSYSSVDLIGFLDILSAVMVIVLLVICVLALSIGVQGSIEDSKLPMAQASGKPVEKQPARNLVELSTVDGRDVTAATAFLLCKQGQIQQFDPRNGQRIRSWSLSTTSPSLLAGQLASPNVYLAVAGSCFPSLDELVDAFRSSGSQLGYEPTTEEAVLPWQ